MVGSDVLCNHLPLIKTESRKTILYDILKFLRLASRCCDTMIHFRDIDNGQKDVLLAFKRTSSIKGKIDI